ncbi:hypothetical protein [Streptomyces sp. NPDC091027]|uniref:hypothetical protein n=1 Tax=Streptomyces sp. NPDC091027 TaxID=3365971 RepID=UPI00382A9769
MRHLLQQLGARLLDLRATTLTTKITALVRDAGALSSLDAARLLRAGITEAGVTAIRAALQLALCLHHAVQDDHAKISAAISRLRDLTRDGDYAYYVDIAHFMAAMPPAALPQPIGSTANNRPEACGEAWSPPGRHTWTPGNEPPATTGPQAATTAS